MANNNSNTQNNSNAIRDLQAIKEQKELDLYRQGYVKTPSGEWIKR